MIEHNNPTLDDEEIIAIQKVVKSGWIAQGNMVKQFENQLCRFLGLPEQHGVALSNGTSSLFIAFKMLNIRPGDEIILSSYNCSALLNAIYMVKAMPILTDINKIDFNPSLGDIESKINSHTKAILITHSLGVPMDIRPLLKFNIPIIEDCAVALGSKIDSKYAGTIGNCTALSFYASKIITTGNGGMFISKNKDLVNKARDYRDFDGVKKYYPRFNFQITDIQAAIGVVQLSKIEKFLELRKEIAMIYKNICFKRGWDYQQPLKDNLYPNWFRFVVKMPEKRILKLKNYLKKRNIETVIPFKQATLLHNYLKLSSNDYPNSQILSTETLSLPIYPNIILSKNIKIIIKALENY